jgi:hypothetical protein
MADLLADANAWLQGVRHDKATQPVRYENGSEHVDIQATIGRTLFESETSSGTRLVDESRDFLVRTQDLDFGGGPQEPRRGDLVKETVGNQTFIYEVMPFGPLEESWRYSGPYRKTLRVHTRLVSTAV